jgi:ankyrin repeat protein
MTPGTGDEERFFKAAQDGDLATVELMIQRGLDVNMRESGDNTYPMHWAAALGRLDIVQRLADAGGDVVGRGDDHELEVIGWATCWDGCADAAHRAVADFLVSRGAKHHIFSAISMNLEAEVRRIVSADQSALGRRMSRNENNQTPLHFAVRKNLSAMVALLVELGADPLAVDSEGATVAMYADNREIDRPVMAAIHAMTKAELTSADRVSRASRGGPMDLAASLALAEWAIAERLVRDNPELLARGTGGVLHLMAKRNDAAAVKWLLDRGVDPNVRATMYGSEITALHVAAGSGATDTVRLLLEAGADRTILDTRFESSPLGWAEHFGQVETRKQLEQLVT